MSLQQWEQLTTNKRTATFIIYELFKIVKCRIEIIFGRDFLELSDSRDYICKNYNVIKLRIARKRIDTRSLNLFFLKLLAEEEAESTYVPYFRYIL